MEPVTAIAGLASSGLNYLSTQKTNEMNKQIMQDQMTWQEEMMDKQNEYNSPVNQSARLRAAGINPALGQGSSPISSEPSAGVGSVSSPTLVAPQFDLTSVANAAFTNAKTIEEKKNIQTNTKWIGTMNEDQLKNNQSYRNLIASNIGLNEQQTKNLFKQEDLIDAQVLESLSRTVGQDTQNWNNRIEGMFKLKELNNYDIKFAMEYGISKQQLENLRETKKEIISNVFKNNAQAELFGQQRNTEKWNTLCGEIRFRNAKADFDFLRLHPKLLEARNMSPFFKMTSLKPNIKFDKAGTAFTWDVTSPLEAFSMQMQQKGMDLKYQQFYYDNIINIPGLGKSKKKPLADFKVGL